ncbi:MAG TPA: hypothetical protein VHL58_05270 [Thermoanaerobaculia bacterium]|nr:hypothetical protein [Thermoanaerobaculia bacterium]
MKQESPKQLALGASLKFKIQTANSQCLSRPDELHAYAHRGRNIVALAEQKQTMAGDYGLREIGLFGSYADGR